MKKFLATTALMLAVAGSSATAQGVPTIDVSSIVQLKAMLTEAQLQLDEAIAQNLKLDEQTLKLLEQIKLMENQIAALRDGFDEAKMLMDGDWAAKMLPEIPDLRGSVEDALRGQWASIGKDGKIGDKSTSSIVDQIFTSAGTTTDQMTGLANSTDPATARIGTQGNTGAMMGVAAEASQVAASESLERLTDLTGAIPDTDGMKAAIDLNTRMTAEMGMALANIWQLEAAQTIGLGQAGVMTAATLADEQKYLDLMSTDTDD
tara:strand:+ start:1625 stop:2410 length:786 start_codon:yes stop_codon:yes gene_type:complete